MKFFLVMYQISSDSVIFVISDFCNVRLVNLFGNCALPPRPLLRHTCTKVINRLLVFLQGCRIGLSQQCGTKSSSIRPSLGLHKLLTALCTLCTRSIKRGLICKNNDSVLDRRVKSLSLLAKYSLRNSLAK